MERLGHFLNKCIVVMKHTCNETWRKDNDYIEVICTVHRGECGARGGGRLKKYKVGLGVGLGMRYRNGFRGTCSWNRDMQTFTVEYSVNPLGRRRPLHANVMKQR